MSVTFSVMTDTPIDWDDDSQYLNCANANARVLLMELGLDSEDLCGSVRARDLLPLIESAEKRPDGGREPEAGQGAQGARWIDCGRPAGRLHAYYRALRDLCEQAGDLGSICWG